MVGTVGHHFFYCSFLSFHPADVFPAKYVQGPGVGAGRGGGNRSDGSCLYISCDTEGGALTRFLWQENRPLMQTQEHCF